MFYENDCSTSVKSTRISMKGGVRFGELLYGSNHALLDGARRSLRFGTRKQLDLQKG